MGVRSFIDTFRIRWRVAALHGATTRAEHQGEHERAYRLATETIELLERCPDPMDPDVLSRYVASVVLLDQMATKLGKPTPIGHIQKAYDASARYRGQRPIDEALQWFEHRLKELTRSET